VAVQKLCDVCRKPTNKIVGKLQYIPTRSTARSHSDYTHHADVGECCSSRLLQLFNFRERMTRKEYLAKRKAG
jgi:hypothetical protein